MSDTPHIIVVGAGLSGLLAALTLSDRDHGTGRKVALIDAGEIKRVTDDGRVTALTPSAMRMLQRLGVSDLNPTPMTGMRVGEGDAATPWQFELPNRDNVPLALNVANSVLRTKILEQLEQSDVVFYNTLTVTSITSEPGVTVTLSDGTSLQADLIVAADGANSAIRRMADFAVSTHEFGQAALVTTVTHDEPHEGIALQRFLPVGAIASLPLDTTPSGHRSQIVWSDKSEAVAAAKALPEDALISLINERLWGALDVSGLDAPVQSYPLITQRSEALSKDRIALVGDAARVIHPLAGQGFNLAIRDIAALAQSISEAVESGQDIGNAGLIGYERWRRADETALATVTGALSSAPQRGPLSILGHARRAAFAAVDEIPSLHALIRKEAAGELGELPPLLR